MTVYQIATACLLVPVLACEDVSEPTPGTVDAGSVAQLFNGQVFTAVDPDTGDLWVAAGFGADYGQVCLTYGVYMPAGGSVPSLDRMPTFTAQVFPEQRDDGTFYYYGEMFTWYEDPRMFSKYGGYSYFPEDANPNLWISPDDQSGRRLIPDNGSVVWSDLISAVEMCTPFEASPTYSAEELSR